MVPNDSNTLLFGVDRKAAVGGRDANGPGAGEGKAQRTFAKGFIVSPVAFYQQILCNTLGWASGRVKVPQATHCAKGASDDDDANVSLRRASGVRGRGRQATAAARAGARAGGRNGSRFSGGLAARSHYRQPAAPLASSTQPFSAGRFPPAAQLG